MNTEVSTVPLPIGGVVDAAFRLYRSTYGSCWYLTLFGVVPGVALSVLLGMAMPPQSVLQTTDEAMQQLQAVYAAMTSPPMLGLYLLTALGNLVSYGALITTQNALRAGKPISLGQALWGSLRGLPSTIVAGILLGLAVLAGCILLLIPGIYFYGKLMLFQTAVYADQAGPLSALGTSWRLTRKRWWRAVAIYTVVIAIYAVLLTLFYVIASVVMILLPVSLALRVGLQQASLQAGLVLFMPLITGSFLTIYHDFKLRAEGSDLAARAAAFKAA